MDCSWLCSMKKGGYSSTEWCVALFPKINNGAVVYGGIVGCSLCWNSHGAPHVL